MVRGATEASNPHRAHATAILSGATMISDRIHGAPNCEQRRWKENKNVLNMLNEDLIIFFGNKSLIKANNFLQSEVLKQFLKFEKMQ